MVKSVVTLCLAACLALLASGAAADDSPSLAERAPAFLREQMLALERTVAAQTPKPLDITNMTTVQYGGAISMAMEGMRLVYGEMTPDEERKFDEKWLPLYRHPNTEIVEYLNALIPLQVQFLALRGALNDAIEAYDATQLEVAAAGTMGDAEGVLWAMESAQLQTALMRTLGAQLEQVVKAILALGDPPDVEEDRRRRRKRHREAFAPLKPAAMLRIVPGNLVAVPKKTYEFRAVLAGAPTDKELQLAWRFSTGRSKRTPVDGVMKHRFWPKDGKVTLECRLIDKAKNRAIARAKAFIEVGMPKGTWVLADRRVKRHTIVHGGFLASQELKETTARTGVTDREQSESLHFQHTWSAPPKRLEPKDTFTFRVGIQGENAPWISGWKRADPRGYTAATLMHDAQPRPNWSGKILAKLEAKGRCGVRNRALDPVHLRGEDKATWAVPEPATSDGRGTALPPDGQRLEIEVHCACHYYPNSIILRYLYRWDPTGSSVTPFGEDEADAAGGADGPERKDTPAQKQRKIEFHRRNAEHFETNVRALEARFPRAEGADARDRLARDLLYAKDALQRERDAIRSLETGRYVRTRTQLDAFNFKVMADESRKLADKWHRVRRVLERGQTLIQLAPPGDRDRLRKLYYQHVNSDVIASGDLARVAKAGKLVAAQVVGHLEQQSAAADEEAVEAAEWLTWAERVRAGADTAMMTLSFGGGTAAYMIYNGATGYVDGGFGTAFQRSLSGYNSAVTIANAAMEGYQRGVLQNLDEYARNPQKVRIAEDASGWKGAGWSAGSAAALMVAMRLGMHVLTRNQPVPRKPIDVKRQQARVRAFRARQEEGRIKVMLFQKRAEALAKAGKAGASKAELGKLRRSLEGSYREVKTDYFAKLRMNAIGRGGGSGGKTMHAYNSVDRAYTKKLQKAFKGRMEKAGYKDQKYKLFSNSASKGKAGMDTDLGVIEEVPVLDKLGKPVMQGGKPLMKRDPVAWRKGLTREMDVPGQGKQLFKRSVQDFQEVGQQELNAAFKQVYGRAPGEAMTSFTTSYHPEAYRDLKWLGGKGLKRGCVWSTDPGWTQQAADVTGFKVNHLPKDHPQLGYYGNLQEQCRGMVKDFDTKLAPLMDRSRSPAARAHVKRLRSVMAGFANNEIGPVEADRQLKMLTGGQGIHGVQDDFSFLMQSLRGWK